MYHYQSPLLFFWPGRGAQRFGEVWLPAEVRFNGSGRALVRKFTLESVVQFSDYRKFSVATDTAFKLPK